MLKVMTSIENVTIEQQTHVSFLNKKTMVSSTRFCCPGDGAYSPDSALGCISAGEKLSDEEVEQLMTGHEDSQGNVNYEEFVHSVLSG